MAFDIRDRRAARPATRRRDRRARPAETAFAIAILQGECKQDRGIANLHGELPRAETGAATTAPPEQDWMGAPGDSNCRRRCMVSMSTSKSLQSLSAER